MTKVLNITNITKITFITFVMFVTNITTLAAKYPVSSNFGWRTHPITGERRFHAGVDLAYPLGTPIRAVKAGKVIYSAYWGGYGKCVILEHPDGDKTLYAHCSQLLKHYQDEVERGEYIATVGQTGRATGPHLHLEWWHNGVYCNPLRLFDEKE